MRTLLALVAVSLSFTLAPGAPAWASKSALPGEPPPPKCVKTSLGKLAKVERPGVVVLGERRGTLPDLARAKALVKKLSKKGPVTLALQAVRADHQDVLDRYARGGASIETMPEALDWQNTWGFPFETYAPLIGLARQGIKVIGVGAPYLPRPKDETLATPPGYAQVLADPMGESPVPVELEARFTELVAWADHTFAATAIGAWDGQGVLVILVDRYHVEGGLGVQWQARTLTEVPVTSALLAEASARCYPSDVTLP